MNSIVPGHEFTIHFATINTIKGNILKADSFNLQYTLLLLILIYLSIAFKIHCIYNTLCYY